jgi:hypothetical protein
VDQPLKKSKIYRRNFMFVLLGVNLRRKANAGAGSVSRKRQAPGSSQREKVILRGVKEKFGGFK